MATQMLPLTQQPRYAAIVATLAELNGAMVKVQGRITEIEMQTAKFDADKRGEQQVEAALRYAQTGVVTAPPNQPEHLQAEYQMLREQHEALTRTIAARNEDRYQLQNQLSQEASQAFKAKHDALCAKYAKKLRELDDLVGEEDALRKELRDLGYEATFTRSLHWPHLGRINDISSSAMYYRAREFAA